MQTIQFLFIYQIPPQRICCPMLQLSLFLMKRTVRLWLWSLSTTPFMTQPEKLFAGLGSVPSSCSSWRKRADAPALPSFSMLATGKKNLETKRRSPV